MIWKLYIDYKQGRFRDILVQDKVPTYFDFEYCNDPGAYWRPTNDFFIVIALQKNTGESMPKNKH